MPFRMQSTAVEVNLTGIPELEAASSTTFDVRPLNSNTTNTAGPQNSTSKTSSVIVRMERASI